MKTMQEIEKMSDQEVATFVAKERETMQQQRFGTGGRDVSASRLAKKNVARALTVLTARTKAAAK
jgi:ribosomal protein L29